MPVRSRLSGAFVAATLLIAAFAASVTGGAEPAPGPPPPQTLAQVDDAIVTDEDVRLALALQFPDDEARRTSQSVRRRMLFTLAERTLALAYFAERNALPSDADVALEIERRKKAFAAIERSWDDELKRAAVSEDAARRLLRWRLAWSRYVDRSLGEANLEKYFARFAPYFDGTERRLAHILFKAGAEAEDRARALRDADDLRRRIVAQEISFEEAVRQFSQAESASDGGDLGRLTATGAMPASFLRPAFLLDKGEVSGPLETPAGVHLVLCLEVHPGTKTYQDVRQDVYEFAREDLFRWIVETRLKSAKIEFVGNETIAEFRASLTPSLLGTSAAPEAPVADE